MSETLDDGFARIGHTWDNVFARLSRIGTHTYVRRGQTEQPFLRLHRSCIAVLPTSGDSPALTNLQQLKQE